MTEAFLSKARTIHVAKKKIWTPARKGLPMYGKVSDISVWDNFHEGDGLHPLTGKPKKLLDFHKGGDNTITSGATAQILETIFSDIGDAFTQRYFDGTYYFPGLADNLGSVPTYSATLQTLNPLNTLFGGLIGIKGGAAGITGKQSTLSGMTWAWGLLWKANTLSFSSGDNYTAYGSITKTIAMTRSIQTAGQPAQYTWNVTITSQASAQQYTIDSVGWVPYMYGSTDYTYFFTPNTTNPNSQIPHSQAGTNIALASASAAPATNISTYISALFVLPYLVTVNANGAIQFTYTFQGN